MDPDDQTQFPADPDQVGKVGKDRDFSFTVTASGNQDSPRALLGQLGAEFKASEGVRVTQRELRRAYYAALRKLDPASVPTRASSPISTWPSGDPVKVNFS